MPRLNLTKNYYPIAFTRPGVLLLHQALSELPIKVGRELLEDIEAQLQSMESPPAAMAPQASLNEQLVAAQPAQQEAELAADLVERN